MDPERPLDLEYNEQWYILSRTSLEPQIIIILFLREMYLVTWRERNPFSSLIYGPTFYPVGCFVKTM